MYNLVNYNIQIKGKLDERYNLAKYNLKKSTIRRTPQYGKLYIVNCTLQMSLHHVQYLFFDLLQLILHLHYNLLHLGMIGLASQRIDFTSHFLGNEA